jgi:hypothetical protein
MPPWCDKYIAVDKCLVREILDLWEGGITTTGCCCGHGDNNKAFIGVVNEDVDKMKKLGYISQYNPHNPSEENTFFTHTNICYYEEEDGWDIPYKFNWWDIYKKEEIKGEL